MKQSSSTIFAVLGSNSLTGAPQRPCRLNLNKEPAIGRSKAVGEPPLCLAMSVVEALSMAVASVADYKVHPNLDMPVTPERVLMGVERMKRERGG